MSRLNRPLFGYRTPNPTSNVAAANPSKLAMTIGAKPSTTIAAAAKSRLPVSTASNLARNPSLKSTPSGIVRQRLSFFGQQQSKTPSNNQRLAALREDKKPVTPKPSTPAVSKTPAPASVKRVASVKQPTTFKPATTGLFSKTPAPKRPLPSQFDKKVSRTVDCAKNIKRRSIKFLNNVRGYFFVFKTNNINIRLDLFTIDFDKHIIKI